MTGLMHTFDFAFTLERGDVFVCNNCYEVRLRLSPGAATILNPGTNSKCDSGAVYAPRPMQR